MVEQEKKTTKIDSTLRDLCIGNLILGLLGEAILLFFSNAKRYDTIGWWFGIALAMFMAVHMWWTLNRGLDFGEEGAPKYLTRANLIRYLVVAIGYITLAVLDFGNPVVAFFGILMLKASAYLQPLVHKCFYKIFHC